MVAVKTAGVATSVELLPLGICKATLAKYTYTAKSKASGKPSFKTEWLITEPEAVVGRKAYIGGSLQEHALFAIKRIGVAVGVPDATLESDEGWDPEEVLPDYYGEQEVTLLVTKGEPYSGKETRNIDVLLEGEQVADSADTSGW